MSNFVATEVVSRDGDIILVVGDTKKRLRVLSHTLSSKSPVFKAMFGPHFREGKQISSAVTAEIPLPEDDAYAMTLICYLLHSRVAPAEDEVLLRKSGILSTALAIDKYQLNGVLHWQIRGFFYQCLTELQNNTAAGPLAAVVAAAYVLNCDEAYTKATALFISNSEWNITDVMYYPDAENIISLLPTRVLFILQNRRESMREALEDTELQDNMDLVDGGLCLRCSKEGKQHREKTCVGHGNS